MTTLRDLPNGRYVLAALDDVTCAAVPHDDPLAPLARRWLNGNRGPGDREALEAWLAAHSQYEITRLPAPDVVPQVQAAQIPLWSEAA